MKIIAITDSYAPNIGGLEDGLERIMAHLQKAGNDVLVVAARNPPALPAEETIRGIRIKRLFFIRPQISPKWLIGLTAIPQLIGIIRKEKPDVVNVHFPHSNALASCFAISACGRVPFIITFHGNDAVFLKKSRLSRALVGHLIKNAKGVTGVSDFVAGSLLGDFAPGALCVRSGIDLNEFDLKEEAQKKAPARFIYATGRFVYKKGFDVLIKAFSHAKIPDEMKLVITGDGQEWRKCKKLVVDLGIGERVQMPGFVSRGRLRQLFRECELFVLPSREEPLGAVVIEAMAAKKPIVATGVGGVPERIMHGRNGLLCRPEEEDMAKKMEWMISHQHQARQMGLEARRNAESETWEKTAEGYVKVYKNAIKKMKEEFGSEGIAKKESGKKENEPEVKAEIKSEEEEEKIKTKQNRGESISKSAAQEEGKNEIKKEDAGGKGTEINESDETGKNETERDGKMNSQEDEDETEKREADEKEESTAEGEMEGKIEKEKSETEMDGETKSQEESETENGEADRENEENAAEEEAKEEIDTKKGETERDSKTKSLEENSSMMEDEEKGSSIEDDGEGNKAE